MSGDRQDHGAGDGGSERSDGSESVSFATGFASDTGRHRAINQDSVFASPTLFVVADGMGGASAGEVASAQAVASLRSASPTTLESLIEAVRTANSTIFQMALDDPSLNGMGTTLIAVAVNDDGGPGQVGVVNVGDSRAYLSRDGGLLQLSLDHSLVETLVRRGQLTPEMALVHPQRNVILRSLGVDAEVDMDAWEFDASPGDRLLLCSDGLFNEVSPPEIASILAEVEDPTLAAERLVDMANDAGGRDNITVLIIDVGGQPVVAAPAPQRLRRILDADLGAVPVHQMSRRGGSSAGRAPAGRAPETATSPSAAAGAAALGVAGGLAAGGGAPPNSGVADGSPVAPSGQPAPAAARARVQTESGSGDEGSKRNSRLTWRSIAFAVSVLVVIGLGALFVNWWASSSYFVADRDGHVAIYQGRPGGFLWSKPTLIAADTGVDLDELPEADRVDVEGDRVLSSLTEARSYVDRLRGRVTTTTTTTTTTSTSTTVRRTTTTRPTTTARPSGPSGASGAVRATTTARPATTAKPAATATTVRNQGATTTTARP